MRDFEQMSSERGGSRKKYTPEELINIMPSKIEADINRRKAEERNKLRVETYGNDAAYRNLGSEDRFNGKVYNNVGTNNSEIKSYTAGYYINGEKRILAKLDRMTPEECASLGEYEYSILGIKLKDLNLLKNNDSYMAGFIAASLSNESNKHR